MKQQRLLIATIALALVATACNNSRRDEIEQRRAALKHKQDSTLLASQHELARVDSALEAAKAEYEQKKAIVEEHKSQLKATAEELTELTMLRMKRDSLQVQWNTLGHKIKYIRKKQQVHPQETK
ncbi:MAG: hypothetical protein K6D91_02835 [Prevotella sp.]|nr:hypothetical protein [Prevotella sp.]